MSRRNPHKDIDGVEHKWCNKCKQYKTLNYFRKNKAAWDGLQNRCNDCKQKYNLKNKIKIKKRSCQYYNNHKEKYAKVRKIYYENNKKIYKKRSRENKKKLRKENPLFKLKDNARRRV